MRLLIVNKKIALIYWKNILYCYRELR